MPDIQDKNNTGTITDQRPFLGLKPFEEKNKSQFGGRDREIRELFGQIENHGLTVVFGKSGIGKTSLIRAGLIPELRQNYYFPIYFRIDYSSEIKPLEQLKTFIYDELKKKDPATRAVGAKTLWEYFHAINLADGLVTPVLILDQFEEMFTLGDENIRDILELLIELADLAENRIPLTVQEAYQKRNETVSSRYGDQPYRVVLSLREDYLASLDELKRYLPSIMANRFRVLQMTIGQAMDAAIKPGKGLIDKEVAREIIKKLPDVSQNDFEFMETGGSNRQKLKVEPFLLSLICDRINEKRIEEGLDKFTIELVSHFNVSDVISSFYNETVRKYGQHVAHALEDRLLTESGFRKLQALEELQALYSISDEVISALVDARIIRKELREGVEYAELIHDVLAPVIKENRDKRLEELRQEQIREEVERNKVRIKSKIIKIGSGLAVVLAFVIAIAIWNYVQRRQIIERNRKMELARNLIIQAQSVGSYEGDYKKAALLARTAFLVFNKFKDEEAGEDMYSENFYNSMYAALKNLQVQFEITQFPDRIRTFAYIPDEEAYVVGLRDATVQNVKRDTLYRFADSTTRVTSMSLFKADQRNLLALAGTFDSLFVYDMDSTKVFAQMAVPDSKKIGKYVAYAGNERLLLGQESGLTMWDVQSGEPLRWASREQETWHESPTSPSGDVIPYKWGETILQLPGKSVNCFAVFRDSTVAIGVNGGIILLNDSKIEELNTARIGKITALKFLPSGQSLIMGNDRGEVFSMALDEGHAIQSHQAHTAKITAIAYSPDNKLLATASRDGLVVIWNEEYKDLPLNTKVLNRTLGPVYNIAFTTDGNYLVAGYDDGTILKWPTNMKMLARLICEKVQDTISQADWDTYIKLKDLKREDYGCENLN